MVEADVRQTVTHRTENCTVTSAGGKAAGVLTGPRSPGGLSERTGHVGVTMLGRKKCGTSSGCHP